MFKSYCIHSASAAHVCPIIHIVPFVAKVSSFSSVVLVANPNGSIFAA